MYGLSLTSSLTVGGSCPILVCRAGAARKVLRPVVPEPFMGSSYLVNYVGRYVPT